MRYRDAGYTVVELTIILVVIAILAAITAIAYRGLQASGRDNKRQADAILLQTAVEQYYADNGSYPRTGACTAGDGDTDECWNDEIWTFLKSDGYLSRIPVPGTNTKATNDAGKNLAPNNKAYYGYKTNSTGSFYALYVPRELHKDCQTVKGTEVGWTFANLGPCDF